MFNAGPTGSQSPGNASAGYNVRQLQNFTPEMMQFFNKLLGGAQGGTQGGLDFLSKLASGDESAFTSAEAPAYSAFNKTLGQLGSRFSQYGARDSSAFQNAVSGAGGQLAENLQAQRQGLRQNAIDKLLGLSTSLLEQRPFTNYIENEPEGFDWGGLIGGAAGAFGGPVLSALGKGAGSYIQNKFFTKPQQQPPRV